ncbi:hypothetical protein [Streptomyces cyaneus]|uniref:hypothetical protein n=1 Tax=Streptomyces cyaneus TaxID=1904 RepID=UPI0015E8E413|nr:hypothetical protein [Streptomyces cyaneus]
MASGHASPHITGHASGPTVMLDDAALEALLSAAVLRGHRVDAEGEQRAVAAFRAARDAGAHRARTRRRDDWRPRAQRRFARSAKTTLSLFVASLALGGAAFAAIGSSGSSDAPAGDKDGPTESNSAPGLPAAEPSSAASDAVSGKPGHPATAQDTEAKCRAYAQVEERGKALDSTSWQRLVTAAGGEDKVAAYCAEQLATAAAKGEPSKEADGGGATGNGQGSKDQGSNEQNSNDQGSNDQGPSHQGPSDENTSGKGAEKAEKAENQG